MNNQTLRKADERLIDPTQYKILLLESGQEIIFDELDFSDGGNNSDHVWLYRNRIAFACIDMRSVSGIRLKKTRAQAK